MPRMQLNSNSTLRHLVNTVCTSKKASIHKHRDTLYYGHWDTLKWQNSPNIWASGHFALAKKPRYTGMGTL